MADALTRMRIALRAEGVDDDRTRNLLFWARAFLQFGDQDEPEALDRNDVEAFLADLTERRHAGAPARNQALEAIEKLYRHSEGGEPAWLRVLVAERRSESGPNVLSRDEVRRLLDQLVGREWLVAALVYGTGMRLLECVRLRVRDIDLDRATVIIRDTADHVRRRLPLPGEAIPRLQQHLEDLKLAHIRDIVDGGGEATLPPVVAARQPALARNWGWQYLFPQRIASANDEGKSLPREARRVHHTDPQTLHQRFERAALDARIYRRVTGHVLRNSFALHMIQQGVPVQKVEQMLGTTGARTEEDATATAETPAMHIPSTENGGRATII